MTLRALKNFYGDWNMFIKDVATAPKAPWVQFVSCDLCVSAAANDGFSTQHIQGIRKY